MRLGRAMLGALIGAIPGLVLNSFSGENLAIFFGSALLLVVGAIVGAVVGWRRGTSAVEEPKGE